MVLKTKMNKESALERILCPLCGVDDTRFLFWSSDLWYRFPGNFRVVQCKKCGLVYVNPRVPPSQIDKYYPDEYYPDSLSHSSGGGKDSLPKRLRKEAMVKLFGLGKQENNNLNKFREIILEC